MRSLFSSEPFSGLGVNHYDVLAEGTAWGGIVTGDGRPALKNGIKAHCPQQPGVYAMLDGDEKILYVGKAKRLRTRLLNYFRRSSGERRKAQRLLRRTLSIVWEYAPHEFAALLRELQLIRLHRPRFNVMGQPLLRRRAYVCLGRAPAPYAYVAKEPPTQGDWFGPLIARPEIYEAVRHLNDLFKLRDCPKKQVMQFAEQRPLLEEADVAACIRHELGTCLGPCARLCTSGQYRYRVQLARKFLMCQDEESLEQIRHQMTEAASGQEYERAMVLRDRMQQLQWLLQNLQRLKRTREELSFIYPVVVPHRNDQVLWYFIHEGQVRGAVQEPHDAATERQTQRLIDEIYYAPPRVGIPLESIDHVWLIAAWFRKFPKERERCVEMSSLKANNETSVRQRKQAS